MLRANYEMMGRFAVQLATDRDQRVSFETVRAGNVPSSNAGTRRQGDRRCL